MMQRRQWLQQSGKAVAAFAAALNVPAVWADQPVRLLVGFPPGGGTDVVARLLAQRLQAELGANIVVDNRPGAGGQIAAQALKAAAPDGHTFFITHDHTVSILPKVVKTPGFDTNQDFDPVVGISTFVNALAVPAAHPAKTFAEYIDWVRQAGDSSQAAAIGIPAPASTPEFLVTSLARHFSLALTPVPYRGSAPMMADMLGNQIHAGIGSVQDFMEYQKSGRMRVLAVLGTQRQASMPDVPTFDELGIKGFGDTPFYGIYAPKGLPGEVVQRWENATEKVLAQPDVRQQLQDWGMTVRFMKHDELASLEAAYSTAWKRIIEESNFAPQ